MMSYDGKDATFYLNKDLVMTEENIGGMFVFLSSLWLYNSHDVIQLRVGSIGYFILVMWRKLGLEYQCKNLYKKDIV